MPFEQGLKEELDRAWKVKTSEVPVVIGAVGAVTPKQEGWLPHIRQHLTHWSRKDTLGNRKDTAQNLEAARPLVEDLSLKGEMRDTPPTEGEEEAFILYVHTTQTTKWLPQRHILKITNKNKK